MRTMRRLSLAERRLLAEQCRDLDRHARCGVEVLAGATTAAQARQTIAALIHDARLLSAVLDEIERAPGGEDAHGG